MKYLYLPRWKLATPLLRVVFRIRRRQDISRIRCRRWSRYLRKALARAGDEGSVERSESIP